MAPRCRLHVGRRARRRGFVGLAKDFVRSGQSGASRQRKRLVGRPLVRYFEGGRRAALQSYPGIQALALGIVSFTAASRNGCRLDWMTTRPSMLAINLPGSSPLSPDRWRDGGLSAGMMANVRTVVETKSRRQLISIGAAVCR